MDKLIIYGAIGGFLINILNLLELRFVPKEERPDFKDILYWLPFIVWPLTGGFLVHIYQATNFTLQPLLAFNVGLSAPLTIRAMAEANPFGKKAIDPGQGA